MVRERREGGSRRMVFFLLFVSCWMCMCGGASGNEENINLER